MLSDFLYWLASAQGTTQLNVASTMYPALQVAQLFKAVAASAKAPALKLLQANFGDASETAAHI
jgi:hypothetical protein